jgi:hypothetical protein
MPACGGYRAIGIALAVEPLPAAGSTGRDGNDPATTRVQPRLT